MFVFPFDVIIRKLNVEDEFCMEAEESVRNPKDHRGLVGLNFRNSSVIAFFMASGDDNTNKSCCWCKQHAYS